MSTQVLKYYMWDSSFLLIQLFSMVLWLDVIVLYKPVLIVLWWEGDPWQLVLRLCNPFAIGQRAMAITTEIPVEEVALGSNSDEKGNGGRYQHESYQVRPTSSLRDCYAWRGSSMVEGPTGVGDFIDVTDMVLDDLAVVLVRILYMKIPLLYQGRTGAEVARHLIIGYMKWSSG